MPWLMEKEDKKGPLSLRIILLKTIMLGFLGMLVTNQQALSTTEELLDRTVSPPKEKDSFDNDIEFNC